MRTFSVFVTEDSLGNDSEHFVAATTHIEAATLYVKAALNAEIRVEVDQPWDAEIIVNQIPDVKASPRLIPWAEITRLQKTFAWEVVVDMAKDDLAEQARPEM